MIDDLSEFDDLVPPDRQAPPPDPLDTL